MDSHSEEKATLEMLLFKQRGVESYPISQGGKCAIFSNEVGVVVVF